MRRAAQPLQGSAPRPAHSVRLAVSIAFVVGSLVGSSFATSLAHASPSNSLISFAQSSSTQSTPPKKPREKPRALAPTHDPSKPASGTPRASDPTTKPATNPAAPAAPSSVAPDAPLAKETSSPKAGEAAPSKPASNSREPANPKSGTTDAWEPQCSITAAFVEVRPSDSPPLETEEERAREQLGKLLFSRCDVVLDEAPMRDALRALRRAIGINLVVFELGGGMPGIDPDQPVSLQLENASGREVLEALAGMTGLSCTWQLHNATVEFGPKATLAREEARFPKLYQTGDLAMDPADYKNEGIGVIGVESYNRRDSDEVIGELVRMITTHCEPEAFKPAPPMMVEDANGNLVIVQHTTPTGGGSLSPKSNPNTKATRNFDPSIAVVYATGQWASIQAKDNNIIVIGPDFVHRSIDGYGKPIPPRAVAPRSTTTSAPTAPTGGTH